MAYISFCIPTYNRNECLLVALKSIYEFAEKLNREVEVCISDNSVNQGAKVIVEQLITKKPRCVSVKYHSNDKNVGPLRNLIKAIKMSEADYIWLFGDDDSLDHNYSDLFRQLDDSAVHVLNRVFCDRELKPVRIDQFYKKHGYSSYDFSNTRLIVEFLNNIKSMDGYMCFISTLLLSRELVDEIVLVSNVDEFYKINIFPHVYLIWKLLLSKKLGCNIVSCHYQPVVHYRSNNTSKEIDSDLEKCTVNYYEMIKLFEQLSAPKDIHELMVKKLGDVYSLREHIAYCSLIKGPNDKLIISELISVLSMSYFRLFIYKIIANAYPLTKIAVNIYRKYIK